MSTITDATLPLRAHSKLRTGLVFFVLAVAMFGFGYAMIPLYYRLCAALGISVASDQVLSATVEPPPVRAMRIEFDANSHNSLVSMRPAQRVTELNTGTAYTMTYEIRNLTSETVKGTAIPAYAPKYAANWFTKLQCFCFNELSLAPGEVIRAPVVFIVEREMPEEIGEMTLSYTFHLNEKHHDHAS